MNVQQINPKQIHDFLLTHHYLNRLPSISLAFALIDENEIIGALTIGKPVSNHLCFGICGKEHSAKVHELNRLVIKEGLPPNTLSFFVGRVLRLLKNDNLIIVSYADTGAGHLGYIYQATNFLYTGQTKQRTDLYAGGNHSRHHINNKELRTVRTSKHRYVYFTNPKNKALKQTLNYPILPYPKGDNKRYEAGWKMPTKVINTTTGEEHYE